MNSIRLKVLFISFLLCILFSSCIHPQKKDLLVGTWDFDKFEFNGKLANIPDSVANKDNDHNKGLSINFSKDNNFKSEQKDGMDNNNSKGTYTLLPDDRLVIMGDTSKIIQLDQNHLKLYHDDLSPVIAFIKK